MLLNVSYVSVSVCIKRLAFVSITLFNHIAQVIVNRVNIVVSVYASLDNTRTYYWRLSPSFSLSLRHRSEPIKEDRSYNAARQVFDLRVVSAPERNVIS